MRLAPEVLDGDGKGFVGWGQNIQPDEAALQVHPTEAYGQAAAGHLRRSVRKGSQGSGSEDDVRGSPLLEAQAGCRAGAG